MSRAYCRIAYRVSWSRHRIVVGPEILRVAPHQRARRGVLRLTPDVRVRQGRGCSLVLERRTGPRGGWEVAA